MVSTSKILTVSYGTFSCTLEGFDDSFETMKAIAEYFRDLAAEDRYFGAEPPVPDAEMLARIAEREIARRVEAREERGNIVLRAQPYGAVAAPLAPQPAAPAPAAAPAAAAPAPVAPAPAAQAPEVATAAPVQMPEMAHTQAAPVEDAADEWEDVSLDAFASETVATAPMATAPFKPTPVPHPDPESVAAKLQRIRDVVTKTAAAPVAESYSEDEHAESFMAETTRSIETALAQDDAADLEADDDDGDEIAALLSRLTGESKPTTADLPEAVTQDIPAAPTQARDLDAALIEDDLAEDEPVTADLSADEMAEIDLAQDDLELDDLEPEDLVPEELAAEDLTAEALAEDVAAAEPVAAHLEDDLVEVDIADDADTETPEGAALPGRVIRMKRADFEAALANGELVPDDADDADDATAALPQKTQPDPHHAALQLTPKAGLSAEDEADLRRELAAVEAELVDIYRDTEGHADPRQTATIDEDGDEDDDLTSLFDEDDAEEDDSATDTSAPLVLRDPREQLVKVRAEDDMSRLMAKAETAMTEPESASRRNAIAHLRAAVAATKAEQSAGTLPTRDPVANAFRDDLASVVRPRRPMGEASAATPRPADARPAPLKLVAEQRVDLPADRISAPVRPRRVSLAPLPDEAEDFAPSPSAPSVAEGEFADFARKMGATALPDLLEAAAAYLVHVEGLAEFSRPQLMNKARQGTPAALSREDGLRSFGQLLRQGKIQKIRGGRFTAAEDIGFKPAARRAG